jgi:methylated-DNA-protein-cysteine methyltransferase related protein
VSAGAGRYREPVPVVPESDFTDAVVEVITAIPRGTVMAYSEVASEAGYPGAARAVGNVLGTVPGLPWWRVVTVDGRLVPGDERLHAELLRAEGVRITRGRVAPHRKHTSPSRSATPSR